MARLPRPVLPGHPQHVIQRGNNRGETFRIDADYRFYLEKLREAAAKYACGVHAYVLMTNHVHILMTPSTHDGVSKAMQMLGSSYVRYYNDRYRRTGTLWEGRYRATLIDTEHYFLACMRYIELNPVRAGMVAHPEQYPWSSCRHTAVGRSDALVTVHDEYLRLGRTAKERQSVYRQLLDTRIEEQTLSEIRDATNKACVLGDDPFKRQVGEQLKRRIEPRERGGDRRSATYRERARLQ